MWMYSCKGEETDAENKQTHQEGVGIMFKLNVIHLPKAICRNAIIFAV